MPFGGFPRKEERLQPRADFQEEEDGVLRAKTLAKPRKQSPFLNCRPGMALCVEGFAGEGIV